DRQKGETMTKAPRAVNVLRIAGVDPKLHAVAIVDSRIAAPRRLLFAPDGDVQADSCLAPGQPDVGKRLCPAQLGKARQAVLFAELDASRRPPLIRVIARRGETK